MYIATQIHILCIRETRELVFVLVELIYAGDVMFELCIIERGGVGVCSGRGNICWYWHV